MKLAALVTSTLLFAACGQDRLLPQQLWLNRGLTEAQVILQNQEPEPY